MSSDFGLLSDHHSLPGLHCMWGPPSQGGDLLYNVASKRFSSVFSRMILQEDLIHI